MDIGSLKDTEATATAAEAGQSNATILPKSGTRIFEKSWNKIHEPRNSNKFQRYTTLHLLNLRFLEEELATMEDQVLRAGLRFSERKQGLPKITFEKPEIDPGICDAEGKVSQEFVDKLRALISQYDEALTAFNDIKGMNTTLLEGPRDHLVGLEERYHGPWVEEMLYTRLVKPQSSNTEDNDPIRRILRKLFVKLSISFRKTPKTPPNTEPPSEESETTSKPRSASRIGNSKAISVPVEFCTRLILALVSGALLIAPLTILSFQTTRKAHLITVAVSTVIFSLLVSMMSKSSNSEIMAAVAGYTAVLVVFFAVAPQSYS